MVNKQDFENYKAELQITIENKIKDLEDKVINVLEKVNVKVT